MARVRNNARMSCSESVGNVHNNASGKYFFFRVCICYYYK